MIKRLATHIKRTLADYHYPLWLIREKMELAKENKRLTRTYLDHLERGGPPPFPRSMQILLTERCNLHCQFCEFKDKSKTKDMSVMDARRILDMAAKIGVKEVNFTGGEPFLHPDIIDIIEYAYNLHLWILLSTNGIYLKKYAAALKRFEERIFISVSVDGMEKTHDELRGSKGAFKTTIEGVLALKEQICGDKIELTMVLTSENMEDVIPVFNLSQKLGVYFNLNPVQGEVNFGLKDEKLVQKYFKIIKNLKYKDYRLRKNWEYYKLVPQYYTTEKIKVRCSGLSISFGVDVNGSLKPCCVWDQPFKIGNLLEEPLEVLWNSPQARQIRFRLFQGNCPSSCFNISYLRDFTRITRLPFLVKE